MDHIPIGCFVSATTDHELGFLMSLHGFEFQFGRGHVVKIEARIEVTKHRPMGSSPASRCTDPAGRRIYGMDNAHGIRHQTEYDHRHVYSPQNTPLQISRASGVAGGLLPRDRTNTAGAR